MLTEMLHALKHTESCHIPMMVIVSEDGLPQAQRALICLAGVKHSFSGRTLRTSLGTLTVRTSNETPPPGEYTVAFLSSRDVTGEEMVRWKNAAQQVVVQGM